MPTNPFEPPKEVNEQEPQPVHYRLHALGVAIGLAIGLGVFTLLVIAANLFGVFE